MRNRINATLAVSGLLLASSVGAATLNYKDYVNPVGATMVYKVTTDDPLYRGTLSIKKTKTKAGYEYVGVTNHTYEGNRAGAYKWVETYVPKATYAVKTTYGEGYCDQWNCRGGTTAPIEIRKYIDKPVTARTLQTLRDPNDTFYKSNDLGSWSTVQSWKESDGAKKTRLFTHTIVDYLAEVEVPAGTFSDCIVKRLDYGRSNSSDRNSRLYYNCKGVGQVKRIDGAGQVRELIKIK